MVTPDVTALQRSDLNQFLFADVGMEANGMTLSVMSMLARQGSDPWGEAGRLAELTRAEATRWHAEKPVVTSRCSCDRCSSDRLAAAAAGKRSFERHCRWVGVHPGRHGRDLRRSGG